MKTRYVAPAVVVLVLMVTTPVFLLNGDNQLREVGTEAYWKEMATQAWRYFEPGQGVDRQTGLHYAGTCYPHFTEWDLGTYIQAIIDANDLGILQNEGEWGFDYRVGKILTFLETRKLADNGLPYLWYDSTTGEPSGTDLTFSIDEGKLYMALYNLKTLKPDLADEIDNIVKVRNNNTALIPDPKSWLQSTDFYCYYVANAFKAFGFEGWGNVPSSILKTIVSQPNITAFGVKLPTAHICNEPLLLTFFEANPQDPRFDWLLSQANMAQEARYNATGHFTAFSEGNTASDPTYVYEFLVDYDGSSFKVVPSMTPITYLKVAVSYYAIFNTDYSRNEVEYVMSKNPAAYSGMAGFPDGVAEDGRVVDTIVDRTSGLILSAAKYVLENGKFDKIFWRTYNLDSFPSPFAERGVKNNVTVVVGESQGRGPVGAAQTLDNLGGMFVVEGLAKENSNETVNAVIDSWLVDYNTDSRLVSLLDNTTNLVIIGSPRINILSYYFNNLRDNLGESLLPVQYVQYENADGSDSYLYVPASGTIYRREVNATDATVADYAVIMGFQDQPDRHVIMVYGLGPEATLGACRVLRDYAQWGLQGSAVVLKFNIDKPGNYPSNCSIVEVVP